MHDDTVFCDEQQRNYVPMGIFMASYFGCRPVFMFDIRLQFAGKNHVCNSSDYVIAADRSENDDENPKAQDTENSMNWDDNQMMFVNSDGEFASHVYRSTYWKSDSDSGTDDGVDAGLNETGSLLWRHITFIIVPNRVSGEPNILFVKITFIFVFFIINERTAKKCSFFTSRQIPAEIDLA